jgi:hypothetical protein
MQPCLVFKLLEIVRHQNRINDFSVFVLLMLCDNLGKPISENLHSAENEVNYSPCFVAYLRFPGLVCPTLLYDLSKVGVV